MKKLSPEERLLQAIFGHCPHKARHGSPCVLTDGSCAAAHDSQNRVICVGCRRPVDQLLSGVDPRETVH